MNIDGKAPPTIDLYGANGCFNIGSSGAKLNYLLTVANGRDSDDHSEFLGLLKPMRERVNLDDIGSLEEILQRDVDDSRVASGIVEYLIGASGRDMLPAFFPSIVVVLVPEIIFENNSAYPKGVKKELPGGDEYCVDYNGLWSFQPILDSGGRESVIGKLTLNKKRVWPIVIDGQHRTMGFRFVAGAYNQGEGGPATYDKFYEAQVNKRPNVLDADLPVTVIWFDKPDDDVLDILEYSRQLFLDINQSSQQIAESRKILLSDTNPMSLLTRSFYNWLIQEKGVKRNDEFSLFHSGFDFPLNLGKQLGWSPTSVFVPELFRFALMQLLLLPNQENSEDGRRQGKLVAFDKSVLPNFETFDSFFGDGAWRKYVKESRDIENTITQYVKTKELRDELTDVMNTTLAPNLWEVLNCYGPMQIVVRGCRDLQEEYDDKFGFFGDALSTRFVCWKEIYCGGTGLYYSVSKSNQRSMDTLKAEVVALEKELHVKCGEEANLTVDDWKWVRSKVLTKAGIIGLFLAYKRIISLNPLVQDGHEAFMEGLRGVDWNYEFFPFVKALVGVTYIKDLDPKSWTAFRDIILLFVASKSKRINVDVQASFERNVFLVELDVKVKSHASSRGVAVDDLRRRATELDWSDDLPKATFDSWVVELKAILEEIMLEGGFDLVNVDWSYSRSR